MREFTDVWEFENDGAGGEACHTPPHVCLDFRGQQPKEERRGEDAKMGRRTEE